MARGEAGTRAAPNRGSASANLYSANALAAGISVFELARIMGTGVSMIERVYGTLIEGAGADIARRLGAFEDKVAERSGDELATDRD